VDQASLKGYAGGAHTQSLDQHRLAEKSRTDAYKGLFVSGMRFVRERRIPTALSERGSSDTCPT
jgi:hypothetical protein